MFARCPKCGHAPLPADQTLPAACVACGVILAKLAEMDRMASNAPIRGAPSRLRDESRGMDETGWRSCLLHVPDRVDSAAFWGRVLLWLAFAAWGLWLMTRSVADGELMQSFIHGPLLVFHEAGHILFMPLGTWMTVAGGTLLQWLMPLVMGVALLTRNRDPFGAALALWLLGVSVMDAAPYLYDALEPQLTLLNGSTGEEGGHDFIFLLDSVGLRHRAQGLGLLLHKAGALLMGLGLCWSGWLLRLQQRRLMEGGRGR